VCYDADGLLREGHETVHTLGVESDSAHVIERL
jgi:hypothetical protein